MRPSPPAIFPFRAVGATALFPLVSLFLGNAAAGETQRTGAVESFLQEYCVKCHGSEGRVKGKVDLLGGLEKGSLMQSPDVLAKVLKSARDLEMPPEDAKQPSDAVRTLFLQELEKQLDESIARHSEPPRTPVRRMNRFQYSNAVQDLFELRVDVFQLPERILRDWSGYFRPDTGKMPDRIQVGNRLMGKSQLIAPRLDGVQAFPQDSKAANGFDNRADLLSLSPLLMESFLELSRSIVYSVDFSPKNVGAWNTFFAVPRAGQDSGTVLRERIALFLERAFRRPVEGEVLERYIQHGLAAMGQGGFLAGMKSVASAALASPAFLYLGETRTTGLKPEPVDAAELASRLSFFLWGGAPDGELAAAAREGRLGASEGIAEQVDRMLQSPKMKRFCDAFASQWMKLEHLQASEPDPRLFPAFRRFGLQTHVMRASVHSMLEPLLLFETVLVENRSILDFIHSDYTYRSRQLDQFVKGEKEIAKYGVGPNYSEAVFFERIPVTDKREGGVITTSAVLTMTSAPTQTKPITRGKWLVETIFNDPPPPPPADVPDLEKAPQKDAGRSLTMRERFALHRERSDCASCHVKLDAFGFALENYDAVGRWRDADEKGNPIDNSGSIFNKHAFQNVEQFKEALLSESPRFVRAFAGHVLKYALGRELAPTDKTALDAIVARAGAADFRLREVLKAVALSEPFRMKFNPAEQTAAQGASPQDASDALRN